jgi:phosphopantothenoylcysteine decarboxylase/phosphopantothenate--cysteine ligase
MRLTKNNQHPSLDIVSSKGNELDGRKIVLCVAGSVAAYKAIELARLLMRHGADVTCVASNAVTKLIQPDYFKWATGNDVITKLTGKLEHIKLADYNQSDLIIVYPATANTLGKLANGIDDTPISTVLTVAFGSKIPIMLCLAMHESMYDNLAVRKNIEFLKNKIRFVQPNMIEGKAKAAEPEDVLDSVIKEFGYSSVLKNKKILITAGPTIEYIDPVRTISNVSSGKTGVLLATELRKSGANVTLIYGPGSEKPSKSIPVINVKTADDMLKAVKNQLKRKWDIVIMAAAISDYSVEKFSKSKIKSDKEKMIIRLKKTPKIVNLIKKIQKDTFLVSFKAEANIPKNKLIQFSRMKLHDSKSDLVIANDIGKEYQKNSNKNEILIIDKNSVIASGRKNKEKLVKIIKKEIEKRIL